MADEDLKERFSEKISGCTDEEVIEILKKRSYYNPVASDLAVKEAIKRGLINSEDDLLAEEYRVKPLRFTIFPPAVNKEKGEKLVKSLARSILFAGILPAILGIYRFTEKQFPEALFLVLSGGIWIASAILILKYKRNLYVYLAMSMAVVLLAYVCRYFLLLNFVKGMDLFIAAVYFAMVFYSFFYLKSLFANRKA